MNLQKYRTSDENDNDRARKITIVLFVIYLIVLSWILLFKLGVRFSYMEERQVNLIPFRDALVLNRKIDFGEIIMNVIIFLPLGIYAGLLFKRWDFGKNIFFFFLISLLVEGLQFILRVGAFDITDTITNTLGGTIGLLIFKAIEKVIKNSVRVQKLINIMATIGTVLLILMLLMLKMNLLPVRYQ